MPTLGTTSAATGVISLVLLSSVVVLGILLADQRVPASLVRRTRRAVIDCPALALKLTREGSVSRPD